MTITKQHYISPLVPESRRRGAYHESNLNAQRNTEILNDFFRTQNPRLKEIPPLIVTPCVSTTAQSQTSSQLVTRNRSKVQHLIDMHIEKRKERRDYFHRNCLPLNENKQANSLRTRREAVIEEPKQELEQLMGSVEERSGPQDDDVVIDDPPVEQSLEVVPNDIKELEKLIEETHALLQAEGVVDHKTIFPNRPYTSDREILEELEKDLERIVVDHQKDTKPQPDSSLNQLEQELNELMQK